jgi:hypothetical protein
MAGAILSRSPTMGKDSRSPRAARDGEDGDGLAGVSWPPMRGPPLKLCSLSQYPQTTRSGRPSASAATTVCIRSVLHARQKSSTESPARYCRDTDDILAPSSLALRGRPVRRRASSREVGARDQTSIRIRLSVSAACCSGRLLM